MKTIKVLHYDAFTLQPHQGNPAGVVLEADKLTDEEMQRIATQVGFNETTFVQHSQEADLRLRYFTPGHEMNLCGHATMASMYALKTHGMLDDKHTVMIETRVGVLPIQFDNDGEQLMMTMKQDFPQFIPFRGDVGALAESIGLQLEDVDMTKPIVYGSTGIWTLLIPLKRLSSFARMQPYNERFPGILTQNPRASLHPFCMETSDDACLMHARHFSSPYSGTIEDPVTGTASGVMGAYYLTYMDTDAPSTEFSVEQGQEMGRDGRVRVKVNRQSDDMHVYVTGTAVYVNELEVQY